MSYAELEIGLTALAQAGQYRVELRFEDPRDDAERTAVHGVAMIDPQALLPLADSPGNAYGLALANSVFAEAEVRGKYGEFKAVVESGEDFLRVKLFVDRSAPELHRLRWELLADPVTGRALSTSERILFSRFGSSGDWRPVRLRPRTNLKALVALSNPTDVDAYGLAPVDVDGETARAREHLHGIDVAVAGHDANTPLTLDRLIEGLRDGIDILYLVCHGGLQPDRGPLLYLQDVRGKARVARGGELAERVGELREPPRLVVLASCESAGSERASTQSAVVAGQLVPLAPALAEAGVHAVLAMQGMISIETVRTAMPVFFAELLKDGQIDRAFAVARGKVRHRPDSWMPALFLRLKGGRIWYEPGSGEGEDGPPLDPGVRRLLDHQKEQARRLDVCFVTPHLLLALLHVKAGFAQRAFDGIRPGLAAELTGTFTKYVSSDAARANGGFSEFSWEEQRDVQRARRLAAESGAARTDDRHLLLAALGGDSITAAGLRHKLGDGDFHALLALVESLLPEGPPPGPVQTANPFGANT